MKFTDFFFFVLVFLLIPTMLFSQTTGKISGKVLDADTNYPLVGANIIIMGTQMGAATGSDGSFYILNIPPGTYTLKGMMMGYESKVFSDVQLSVNRTYELNIFLKPAIIEGQEITVTAKVEEIKKDQTSSIRNVSSQQIELLPVENMNAIVNMQAGVVAGHFRGGRNTEVSYLIDGLQVDKSYDGIGSAISLEAEAIQDLEVITGTFNAEYGRAMSGVVNAVTKEGDNEFHGSFSSAYADFFTTNDDIFIGLNSNNLTLNLSQDYKLQLSGPIIQDKIFFFTNIRYRDSNGYLNGIRRFTKLDYNDFSSSDSTLWHSEHSGDNTYVSMQTSKNLSLMAKLTFKPFSGLRINALYSLNDDEGQGYNHYYKYNPDYRGTDYNTSSLYAVSINHLLSSSMFYEFKASYLHDINEDYKFKDPLDSRYVHPRYQGDGNTGFNTGGMEGPGIDTDTYSDLTLKFDFNWQMNVNHNIKTGIQYINHTIDKDQINVRNKWNGTEYENIAIMDSVTGKITFPYYELEIDPITDLTMGVYTVKPFEYSAYIQDKMEFDEMVINIGLRYDYFNSNHIYPSDRRNPSNQLSLPDSMMSQLLDSDPQLQLSPRLGLAYQLGKKAVLHFSYGHFFQMPPMRSLYTNNKFRVPTNDFGTVMGNTQLKPQKTVSYEIGLWQELMQGMGFEIALYYRDIYDLLSTKIITTYNQIEYGLYNNKDYGNARGIEIKWDYSIANFYTNINYTLQYTRGNADNPTQTFDRAGDSRDPIKRLIPMSWDQRHTFNYTIGYSMSNYGITMTGYYNSGTPYTYQPQPESPLAFINLYSNNDWKPGGFSIDLMAFYTLHLTKRYKAKLTLSIYNLLDRKNTVWVYNDTGQPYTTIVRPSERASHRSDFNTYQDRVENPGAYSAPRQIKLGVGVTF